jgi:lipopolysaccharide export system protein LptC
MAMEIQLPDLPDIQIGDNPPPRRGNQPWHLRLRDALSAYLPLLLMAALALATWWLVRNTPGAPAERKTVADPAVPDYSMRRFTLQRYAPDGRLIARLEGNEMRHYPAGDRIEVDQLRLQAWAPDGRLTTATARQAVSNCAASELELKGGAEVVGTDQDGTPVEIRSEFLQAFIDRKVVRTSLPVTVKHGASQLRAVGLNYDIDQRRLDFLGPVKATLQVKP